MTDKRDRSTTKRRIKQSSARVMAKLRHPEPTLLDERDLVVPAREQGGLSETLNVRVRQFDIKRMQLLRENTGYGDYFETKSDFARAALHLGMCVMEGCKVRGGVFTAVNAIDKLTATHMEIQAFRERIEKLEEVISYHLKTGSHGEARSLVLAVRREVGKLPPDSRKMYGEMIDRTFAHVLGPGMPSINPDDMDKDGEEAVEDVADGDSDGDGGEDWPDE